MSKKSIKSSFLLCLFLSLQTASPSGRGDTFVKFFHINSENLQEVFDVDPNYWNNEKQDNLRSYFRSDTFDSLKETFFRAKTVEGLEKEMRNMDTNAKKILFSIYCQIIEKCCFSELNLLSEEDTHTGTRSIKIERSKIKDLFSKYRNFFLKKHAEVLLNRAFAHSLTYLLCTEKIRNPYCFEKITDESIDESIGKINKSQEEKNYKEVEKKVYIPNAKLKITTTAVIKDATDRDRYKTISKLQSAPLNPSACNTSLIALELFDKMWRQNEAKRPEDPLYTFVLESHYIQSGVHQGLTASSFDPRALYGVLSYIRDNTAETKFEKRGPFETFYDPCGGWGERFFAAALAKEDNFTTIKVNDLNHDLKEGYEKLKKRYEDFCKENNLKNITFTYEDALKNESNQEAKSNDFIFTGLPFFDREVYPNMLKEWTTKGRGKPGKYAFQKWLAEWTVPLIEKLIASLSPGGILAFNIGSTDQMPLAHELGTLLAGSENYSETRSCGKGSSIFGQSFEGSKIFKDNITDYTKKLWGKIFYGVKGARGDYSPIIILQKKMHTDVEPQSNPTQ